MIVWRLSLLLLILAFAAPACGTALDAGDANEEGYTRDVPEPPESTLSYGDETVIGGLGTYCWSSAAGGSCVDAAGVGVGEGALTVPAGSKLSFAFRGKGPLDSLRFSAYPIGEKNRLEPDKSGVLVPADWDEGYEKFGLGARRSGTQATVPAELPTGEHVIEASLTAPPGDASYGFRVVVEGPGNLPATGGL